LGPAARRDGARLLPRLPRGGARDDRPEARRRHQLHQLEELDLRGSEQHRLLRAQGRPGAPGAAAGRPALRPRPPGPPPRLGRPHTGGRVGAELGRHGIRVHGIDPAGVVRGSGIFAGGWGAQRAAVYGVPEAELGAYYAQRTLLAEEVLPEHVAAAAFALAAGDLSQTTGLHIPVDSGVAAAFLR